MAVICDNFSKLKNEFVQKIGNSIEQDINIIFAHEIEKTLFKNYDLIILIVTEYNQICNKKANHLKFLEEISYKLIILSDIIIPNSPLSLENFLFMYLGYWMKAPVNSFIQDYNTTIPNYLFDFLIGKPDVDHDHLHFVSLKEKIYKKSFHHYTESLLPKKTFKNKDFDLFEHELCLPSHNDEYYRSTNEINDEIWSKKFENVKCDFYYPNWISRIVPDKIYKNSLCSLVRETLFWKNSPVLMATEKTAKPILCKRLFFTLGPPGHNKLLKSVGFKIYHEDMLNVDCIEKKSFRIQAFIDFINQFHEDDLRQLYIDNLDAITQNYKLALHPKEDTIQTFILQSLDKIKY